MIRTRNKKLLILGTTAAVMLAAVLQIWLKWLSPTRIAFVNYQAVELSEINRSNDNSMIKISEIKTDKLNEIKNYHMVFINAMGLRITQEQRTLIENAAGGGLPILTTAATNPANNINSLNSTAYEQLTGYLANGGRKNYRSMLNYVRKFVDKKIISVTDPDNLTTRDNSLLYHSNPKKPDDENLGFNSVAQYNAFLRKVGLFKASAPGIIVTGQMGDPADLVSRLEQTGNVVYLVRDIRSFVTGKHIDSVNVSAIINMAHGRIGDYVVNYLKEKNIPLFTTLNVNKRVEEWEADKMGMSGGFLSQSIVTPEIDGAIRPYVLFARRLNSSGIEEVFAIPERLESFVGAVNRHIALQTKNNSHKRIAIYYYKGPGQGAITAAGMEVAPSLFNLLTAMKMAGYNVTGLPGSAKELEKMIQAQGSVFQAYHRGANSEFVQNGDPELVSKKDYAKWVNEALSTELYNEVVDKYGEFPGKYMNINDSHIAISRLSFGNVVLLPQNMAGEGDNTFAIVHGTNQAPPHPYIASYLWAQHGFKADALVHFGTHGSLEFTPRKQVALSKNDWPDRLVGSIPHFYIYSIDNVGEGMIAKRRSYATLQSHLTPPFLQSELKGTYNKLLESIKTYNSLIEGNNAKQLEEASLKVKDITVKLGIHRELGLDSLISAPFTPDEISHLESFAEELVNAKITGQLYTMGKPYEADRIASTVYAMATDPIAYSLLALDRIRNKDVIDDQKHKSLFTLKYLNPARELVGKLLKDKSLATDQLVCKVAGISQQELEEAQAIEESSKMPQDMMQKMPLLPLQYSKEQKLKAQSIMEVKRAIFNINGYRKLLGSSPTMEIESFLNALNGGFTAPSSGGDPITNCNVLPTGRNLYAINAENTPSEQAWEKGKKLADNTIAMYRKRHNDSIPRKVSYTLWSGEFIETEGATIAQVLYMLGVEPVRDAFGRVTDLRLISSKELGRPRIDVVVQTSGQLRDIAASRLFLINRAVEMAAAAKDREFENQVSAGVVETERVLIEKGLSPKEAREVAYYRVFGGVNGNYGTGITGMVQSSDRWSDENKISSVYLNNMGAFYGDESKWEQVQKFAFEAALTRTDAVVQPRQSNTWGALSLDHVYEFMGGMNLAVRNITGKDPDAYLSDYRNHNNMRMQEVKEAIGVESRTTIFNPTYIKEKMKGEASSADSFLQIVENTFGWNVMKPNAIDNEMWDEIYNVYVEDKFKLGTKAFFEEKNPAALQDITATMLESARKGMWKASQKQLKNLAQLHTQLVDKYKLSGSYASTNNKKLQDFIASNVDVATASNYQKQIDAAKNADSNLSKGMVMKKEEIGKVSNSKKRMINNVIVGISVIVLLSIMIIWIVKRRRENKSENEEFNS